MSKPVILIVDNDRDSLETIKDFLELDGYWVHATQIIDEAERVLNSKVVHLAILDLRLTNDNDVEDVTGLKFAKSIDTSVSKIIRTGWPTYEYARQAFSIKTDGTPGVVDFVSKHEGLDNLSEAVKHAMRAYVRINFSLGLSFAGGLSPEGLVQGSISECAAQGEVTSEVLIQEFEDLLRKLFNDYEKITIAPFTSSTSGGAPSQFLLDRQRQVVLIEVRRVDAEGVAETVIVKIAPRTLAKAEWDTYNNAYFDKTTRPLFESYAETQRLGGAVYVPGSAMESLGIVYWDAALMAWSDAATGARGGNKEKFEQGTAAVARCLGERLAASLMFPATWGEEFLYGVLDTSEVFPEHQMPDELPVLFLYGRTVEPEALDRMRRALGGRASRASGMALIFVFNSSGEFERLKERLTHTYAWDAVTAGQSELRAVVVAESPVKELRSLMLSQIDIYRVSPFKSVGETPDAVFFGREAELRTISRHARDASYAVIAGRRFGKTSLLGQLHRARLPAEGLRTIYHDLSLTPTFDDLRAAAIRSWRGEPPPNAPRTFGELFDAPPSAESLVLLLDEADKTVDPDRQDGWRLLNHLRALSHAGAFRVVLSGEHTLREALREPDSPLFNFVEEMLLGPLDYGAVEELVTRPMSQMEIRLEDEESVVNRIYSFTSGHPNIVQRLCSRLVGRLNQTGSRIISLADVDAVIEDTEFKQTDFLETYWDRATHLEKIITLLMSREPGRYRTSDISSLLERVAGIDPEVDAVMSALDRLTDIRSILRRSAEGYEFAVEAFPLVLNGSVTFDDQLRSLVAQIRRRYQPV